MTDPATPIRTEVHRLIEIQIATLGKRSPLSSSDLNEYHMRSEKIADLLRELDAMVRTRFQYVRPRLS